MYLPQVHLFQKRYPSEEIFFETDQELMRVLIQGNPVYLVLDLPGLITKIIVCFPAPTITRIYAVNGKYHCFIAESLSRYNIYTAPDQVKYRYGMQLLPWMFLGDLNDDIPIDQSHIVNYIVLNCGVGHEGINIRILRSQRGQQKNEEWLEIHQFSTGNEYHFSEEWKKQSRMIARFVPGDMLQFPNMTWKPEDGWAKHPPMEIDCKI